MDETEAREAAQVAANLRAIEVALARRDARGEPRPVRDQLRYREPPLNPLDAFAADSDADGEQI